MTETSPQAEQRTSDSLVVKRRRFRRPLWAELLKSTFGVDPEECPHCGVRMKLIATIMRADVVNAERKATERSEGGRTKWRWRRSVAEL